MGNSHDVDGRAPVHAFYSAKSWIEGTAVRQLEAVARIPGISAVAGMPDLHPGKFGPVGCAILADHIHPAFVFELAVSEGMAAPRDADIRFESFRAGGPGGQHQNKTESAVRAVHVPTGLVATARDERSQHRNKALAIERLKALLDAKARLAQDGEARLIHAAHHTVERGATGLRFEGPAFKPAKG